MPEMWSGALGPLEVRRIHPYEAVKAYTCPSCNNVVGIGVGHYVVVPSADPELRRHWHKACWDRHITRGAARSLR